MSDVEQNLPLQDAISLRSADLQIDAVARHSAPWAARRLLLLAQVAAWVLAVGACALPVILVLWLQKPISPYGVTATGHVSSLVVVEEEKVRELVSAGRVTAASPDLLK